MPPADYGMDGPMPPADYGMDRPMPPADYSMDRPPPPAGYSMDRPTPAADYGMDRPPPPAGYGIGHRREGVTGDLTHYRQRFCHVVENGGKGSTNWSTQCQSPPRPHINCPWLPGQGRSRRRRAPRCQLKLIQAAAIRSIGDTPQWQRFPSYCLPLPGASIPQSGACVLFFGDCMGRQVKEKPDFGFRVLVQSGDSEAGSGNHRNPLLQ